MFTGIVEAATPVVGVSDGEVRRLVLDLAGLPVRLGDSVAVNGCCLTVAALEDGRATFEAVPETLKLTTLGRLRAGTLVNIERALQAGARFDGHFVQGHVDGVGEITQVSKLPGEWRVQVRCGREFARMCIHKGSVCVDGISLTIAELAEDAFTVAVIPHTLKVTNAQAWAAGTRVNLEADMIGKYVRRQMDG